MFDGGIFAHHSYYELRETKLKQGKSFTYSVEQEKVLISDVKEILREVRCFILDGEIVTMSEYKTGNKVIYKNIDFDIELKSRIQELVDIYHPAEGFVLDVCEIKDSSELKIIEVNCLNCSGFYDIDLSKLIQSIYNKYEAN